MLRLLFKCSNSYRNQFIRAINGNSGPSAEGAGSSGSSSAFERKAQTKEEEVSGSLRRALPGLTYLSVEDISGGCGAMFEINIEAKEFVGLSRVKQHRLVTEALKNEIAEMHGIRIHTTTPAHSEKK